MRWEYQLIEIEADPETMQGSGDTHPALVRLGTEGWEAVGMYGRIEKKGKDEPMPMQGWRYSNRTILIVLLKRRVVELADPRIRSID